MARIVATVLGMTILAMSGYASAQMGFVVDPNEKDAGSLKNRALAIANSNLVAIHLDQCVPWAELLDDKPLPVWLINSLKQLRANIPETHTVSLAVTPTAMDRKSIAPSCGPHHHMETALPREEISNKKLDNPVVKAAFLKYVLALIEILEPEFVNIGIEISELAVYKPSMWPEYGAFFSSLYGGIKAKHKHVQVGMEMVLQSLMEEKLFELLIPTFAKGDFLGISFYPYGSPLAESFLKQTALSDPPEQWREGFRFLSELKKKFDKPLAFCETGYLSKGTTSFGVSLEGTESVQSAFTRDLIQFMSAEDLAFVIWFVPVDYHKALLALPKGYKEFIEAGKIWSYSGLWNEDRTPKPALSEWRKGLHSGAND